MQASYSKTDEELFSATARPFPLLCGMEFMPRPIRLSKESRKDFNLFAELGRLNNWLFDRQRIQLFLQNPAHALIVTDIRQSIQFVNHGFSRMTGYADYEALNQFPSFLQGEGTSLITKQAIRASLIADKPFEGDILNYRKSGEPYWCRVGIEPIRNRKQQIIHYVAFEREVHRPANLLSLN